MCALWIHIRGPNTANTILGCLYHPPTKLKHEQDFTRTHIEDTLEIHLNKYTDVTLSLMGDFNCLVLDGIMDSFDLRQLVNFNTQANSKLHLLFTNSSADQQCEKLAPLAKNDHCTIFLPGENVNSEQYMYETKRHISPNMKDEILLEVRKQDWTNVLQAVSVDEKV